VFVSNAGRVDSRDVDLEHRSFDHADRNSIPAALETLRVDLPELQLDQHAIQIAKHRFVDPV